MTNEEFAAFRRYHFASRMSAAEWLEIDRETIKALETGLTRSGRPYPVSRAIALACLAINKELVKIPLRYSRRHKVGPRRKKAQTVKILRLADGTLTIRQIADKLGIDRKPVYAAITWSRENGGHASFLPDRKREKPRPPEVAGQ